MVTLSEFDAQHARRRFGDRLDAERTKAKNHEGEFVPLGRNGRDLEEFQEDIWN